MGATFNRLKTWISETLTASDLNAEFNNILDNFTPTGMDDYSANNTEMQTQVDPGGVGTESRATNLAGEVARLRHQMAELKGTTYWYSDTPVSLQELNNLFSGTELNANRIVSGPTTGNSTQSLMLDPEGSAGDNITIRGATTDIVYYIDGTQYTLDADVSITVQTPPPTTNNTCLIDDATAADGLATKWAGEYDTTIPIDTIGSAISSRDGQTHTFKLSNGSATEYFMATIDNSNSVLKYARRGWFYSDTGARIPRITYANNDTITLMNTNWLFLDDTGALVNTYTMPVISATQPSAPANGDYWFDLANSLWKRWDGAQYVTVNVVFVGVSVIDENSDCVAARSVDYSSAADNTNTVQLDVVTNTTVTSKPYGKINVYGSVIDYQFNTVTWDITTDLDSGVTEAASTIYYLYIKEDGDSVISDVKPMESSLERQAYYHPHETWRCVGEITNNGSSNLDSTTMLQYGSVPTTFIGDSAVTTAKIADGNVTQVKRVALGQQISASSGTYSTGVTGATDVTNLSVTITTTGRPVYLTLQNIGTGNSGYIAAQDTSGSVNATVLFLFIRGSTEISRQSMLLGLNITSGGTDLIACPASSLSHIDTPVAGTYTYKVQIVVSGTGATGYVYYSQLVAFEL